VPHGVGVVLVVDVVLEQPLYDILGVRSVLMIFVVVFCLLWVCR